MQKNSVIATSTGKFFEKIQLFTKHSNLRVEVFEKTKKIKLWVKYYVSVGHIWKFDLEQRFVLILGLNRIFF